MVCSCKKQCLIGFVTSLRGDVQVDGFAAPDFPQDGDAWVFGNKDTGPGVALPGGYSFAVGIEKNLPPGATIHWDFGALGKFVGARVGPIDFPGSDNVQTFNFTVKVCADQRV